VLNLLLFIVFLLFSGGAADFWDHVMDMATGKELGKTSSPLDQLA
jgi:hypothetical protein